MIFFSYGCNLFWRCDDRSFAFTFTPYVQISSKPLTVPIWDFVMLYANILLFLNRNCCCTRTRPISTVGKVAKQWRFSHWGLTVNIAQQIGIRKDGNPRGIGHFRVPKHLTFKARLSAKPLIWKWFLIMMQIKLFFTTKVSHLASFWKRDFLELGNGLLFLICYGIYFR